MNGTPVCGERVVVLEVQGGNVRLKTGRITSTAASPAQADNQIKTVVRGDRQFHATAESPDEAYQKSFHVSDIHLLKAQEAQALRDPGTVQNWFGSIYQDHLLAKIHRAFRRLKEV